MIQQYPKDKNSCSANFYLALAFTDNNESCLIFSLKFLFRKIIFVSYSSPTWYGVTSIVLFGHCSNMSHQQQNKPTWNTVKIQSTKNQFWLLRAFLFILIGEGLALLVLGSNSSLSKSGSNVLQNVLCCVILYFVKSSKKGNVGPDG